MQITRIPAQRENRKTRIAVYCRVSTKMEEQEDSLETQKTAYIDRIESNPEWELAGVFADNLSGLSAEKRPEFVGALDDLKDVVKAAMAETGGRPTTVFNQYNTSPKALSRLEIYRQSRNLLSLARG